MVTFPDDMQWDCPICDAGVLLTAPVVHAFGAERAVTIIEHQRDIHIGQHCEEFVREIEYAL